MAEYNDIGVLIDRPRLDKDTFVKKLVQLAKQRENVLQLSHIKELARDRLEGKEVTPELLDDIKNALRMNGCFLDDDIPLNESYNDVRHYTNNVIDLLDTGVISADWLAKALMNYMSEDEVADFAHYNDYFDVDEIESPYDVRQATNHMIELIEEGALDASDIAKNLLSYMSEDTVAQFCKDNELDYDDVDLDEEIEEETLNCKLCGSEEVKSDMHKEKDLGWICDSCLRELESRGEDVEIVDDMLDECSTEPSIKEKNARFRKH